MVSIYVTFSETAKLYSLKVALCFSPAVSERSSCSVSSPALGVSSLYSFSRSNRYRVVSLWF